MTLLQNRDNTDVVCAPTHHFCNLGCKMCHLTTNKLNKEMIAIEIDDFIEALLQSVCNNKNERITNKKKLLISFMGVGEPLLNLELIRQVYLHRNELCNQLNYDYIGFALSTMMPIDNIDTVIELVNSYNIPLKIHFSLHSPIDKKRNALIPSSKVSIENAFAKLSLYKNIISKNKDIMREYTFYHRTDNLVEIHYTLIENNNDTEEEKELLGDLLKSYNLPIKFIEFNPKENMQKSKKIDEWVKYVNDPDL